MCKFDILLWFTHDNLQENVVEKTELCILQFARCNILQSLECGDKLRNNAVK